MNKEKKETAEFSADPTPENLEKETIELPPLVFNDTEGNEQKFYAHSNGKYPFVDDQGDVYGFTSDRVKEALDAGMRPATPEDIKHYENVKKYDNLAGEMKSVGLGIIEGVLPLSTGNRLLEGLGVANKEEQEAIREISPMANALGQGIGFTGLTYLTAGLGTAAAGTRAGAKAIEGINAAAKVVNGIKVGQQALKLTNVAKDLANGSKALTGISKVAGAGAKLLPESIVAGVSEELTDSFLKDKEITAEALLDRARDYSIIGFGLGAGTKALGMIPAKEYVSKLYNSIPETNFSARNALKFLTRVDDDALQRVSVNKEAVQNAKNYDVLGRDLLNQGDHLFKVNHQKLNWAEEAIGDSLMPINEVVSKLRSKINELIPHRNVANHEEAIKLFQGTIDSIEARANGTKVIDAQFLREQLVKQRQAGNLYSRGPHYNKFMSDTYTDLAETISNELKHEFKEYGNRMKEVAPGFQLYKELDQVAYINTFKVSAAEDNGKLLKKAFEKDSDPALKRTLKKVNEFNMANPVKTIDDFGVEHITNASNIMEDILNRRAKDSLQNSFEEFTEKFLARAVGVGAEVIVPGPAFIKYIAGKEIAEKVLTRYTPTIQDMTLGLMKKLEKKSLAEVGETLTSKNLKNSFIISPTATVDTIEGRKAMMEFLNKRGFKAFTTEGIEGIPENSIVVANVKGDKIKELQSLAQWMAQEQSGKTDLIHLTGEKAGQKASPIDTEYFAIKKSKTFEDHPMFKDAVEFQALRESIDDGIDAVGEAYKSYKAGVEATDLAINPSINLITKIKSGVNEIISRDLEKTTVGTATRIFGKAETEDPEKLFLKNREAIETKMQNPKLLEEEIDNSLLKGKGYSEAQVQAGLGEINRIRYLYELLPQLGVGSFYQEVPPTKEQMRKFNQMVELSADPVKSLHLIKMGMMTQEVAKMVATLYPGSHRMISQMLLEGVQKASHIIPYTQRLGISIFTGIPVGVELTPGYLAASSKGTSAQPPQQGSQGIKPKLEFNNGMMTQTQKITDGGKK